MAEFTRFEIYQLLNGNQPLWLGKVDLSEADLRGAVLRGAIFNWSKLE